MEKLIERLADDEGAGLAEYSILVAGIAIVAIAGLENPLRAASTSITPEAASATSAAPRTTSGLTVSLAMKNTVSATTSSVKPAARVMVEPCPFGSAC